MAKVPQLADEKGNKVSTSPCQIFSQTLYQIQAEQNRIRDTEHQGKPAAAVVVQRMWEAYARSIGEQKQPIKSETVIKFTDSLHATLDKLLATGERAHIEAILRWGENWLANRAAEPEVPDLAAETRQAEHLMRQANETSARISDLAETDGGDESALLPGAKEADRKRRKKSA